LIPAFTYANNEKEDRVELKMIFEGVPLFSREREKEKRNSVEHHQFVLFKGQCIDRKS
jgi:hypothetical protein